VGVAPVQADSALATAAFVLGILGLCTGFAGIPAVICGHLALNRINRAGGTLRGKGLATAGLVIGYIGIGLLIVAALSELGR
jgi:hypothetical protein